VTAVASDGLRRPTDFFGEGFDALELAHAPNVHPLSAQ
jgi:hypothetical protein